MGGTSTDQINNIVSQFNSYHDRLQFTFETEKNNSIPFLDVLVIRDGNKLSYDWYHKPTWSGRYINFYSLHPLNQKIGLIKHLTDKALTLSTGHYRPKNIKLIKDVLTNNDYPKHLVEDVIQKRVHEFYNKTSFPSRKLNMSWHNTVIISYLGHTSDKIKHLFKKSGLNVVFKTNHTLKDVIFKSVKDKIPTEKINNIIYSIPCKGCQEYYIGQTKNSLHTRIYQHKYSLKNPHLANSVNKTPY